MSVFFWRCGVCGFEASGDSYETVCDVFDHHVCAPEPEPVEKP